MLFSHWLCDLLDILKLIAPRSMDANAPKKSMTRHCYPIESSESRWFHDASYMTAQRGRRRTHMSVLERKINVVAVSLCMFLNRSHAINETYRALSFVYQRPSTNRVRNDVSSTLTHAPQPMPAPQATINPSRPHPQALARRRPACH